MKLDDLPRDIPPARDLWPSIAERIQGAAEPVRPRRRWGTWLPWAVTAALALFVSGAWWVHRPGGRDPLASLPLEARLGATQSLDAVRDAREQVLAELARNGDDPALREWLADLQQQEARVTQAIADAGERARAL